jgi:FAD/FMN-containing dehydrogenase
MDLRTIDEEATARLRARFRGELLLPSAAGYESARHIWNAVIDKHPALIARCSGVADIVAAVRFAREEGLVLAIRGGGHNVAGTAMCDGGLVLDLSQLKGVRIDTLARTARIQPGVTNGDLDHETQAFGLATTGGIASTTGVTGLTLGGGLGWLMRRHGLACDNLLSADMVTAEGTCITANRTEHADLFWALRGGGGNFGVVTSLEYRLHPVGPSVVAGLVLHPAERAREVLRFYRDYVAAMPDELTTIVNLRHAPPAPWLPPELHGRAVVAIMSCHAGSIEEGFEAVRPLKQFGPPLFDLLEPKPYVLHQRMFDDAVPPGLRYYWKSHYLRALSDQLIDALAEHAWRDTSARSYTLLFQMGGAVARLADDATAFASRGAPCGININAVWAAPEEDRDHIEWARAFFAATEPFSTGGVYVNFLGTEGEERIRAAYGANYERLAQVKARYDPTNFFRVNQNVRPPSRPTAARAGPGASTQLAIAPSRL